MRWLAALGLLWALPAAGGTMASLGSTAGAASSLIEVFPIWGDTQQLARDIEGYDAGAGLTSFQALATWACAQRADPLNDGGDSRVRGVLQMGDIVDTASVGAQWTQYGQARDILETCATGPIPAVPTVGNHDVVNTIQSFDAVSDGTLYQQNAGKDQIDTQPWFGGRGNYQELQPLPASQRVGSIVVFEYTAHRWHSALLQLRRTEGRDSLHGCDQLQALR